jgi:maltose alpha-D-glucosyltransferase/alpha-amylase
METYILEKAVYELNYELNNRPDWVLIPIRGIESIINRHNND